MVCDVLVVTFISRFHLKLSPATIHFQLHVAFSMQHVAQAEFSDVSGAVMHQHNMPQPPAFFFF